MEYEQLELAAYKNEPMPEGLTKAEQSYFLAMRGLYSQYKVGNLDSETAKSDKKRLKAAMLKANEIEEMKMREYRELQENIKAAEQLKIDCLKNDDGLKELCRKLLKYVSLTTNDNHFCKLAIERYGL